MRIDPETGPSPGGRDHVSANQLSKSGSFHVLSKIASSGPLNRNHGYQSFPGSV